MRFANLCTLSLVAAISFFTIPSGRAAYIINVQQVGSDVVATGSGSLNLSGLVQGVGYNENGSVFPNDGFIVVGPTGALGPNADLAGYGNISGTPSFGGGGSTPATFGSGAPVGIFGSFPSELIVPLNYTGGDLGTSTDTWSNQTIDSLGLATGTFIYTWDFGVDSLTVNISVPEPASLSLLALAGIALLRRSRS